MQQFLCRLSTSYSLNCRQFASGIVDLACALHSVWSTPHWRTIAAPCWVLRSDLASRSPHDPPQLSTRPSRTLPRCRRRCHRPDFRCRTRRRADQDRSGHRVVGPVGAGRRSHHARARGRDRRDQCQGRPARRPKARTGAPRRRSQPGQGRGGRARIDLQGKGRGAVRRAGHAGVHGHRADRQPGEDAVHEPVGRRHADHQERREPQLRLPRLGGG